MAVVGGSWVLLVSPLALLVVVLVRLLLQRLAVLVRKLARLWTWATRSLRMLAAFSGAYVVSEWLRGQIALLSLGQKRVNSCLLAAAILIYDEGGAAVLTHRWQVQLTTVLEHLLFLAS